MTLITSRMMGAGAAVAASVAIAACGSSSKSSGSSSTSKASGSTSSVSATINVAGSDPALKSSDEQKMKGPVLQFPVAFGAITVSYNLSDVKSGLKLDGPT